MMRRGMRAVRLAGALSVIAVSGLGAQNPALVGMSLGYTDVGGVVGLGGLGEASLALGGRFERVFKAVPDLGDGLIGLGVSVDWYSYSVGAYDWTYLPIGATANYHFKMDNRKWDPFLGLGLGYYIVSAPDGFIGSWNSGVYLIGRAGVRYFMTSNMAFYADAGAGSAALSLGLTWKLKG